MFIVKLTERTKGKGKMKEYIFVPNASPAFRKKLRRGLIDEAQLHGMYSKRCQDEYELCEVYDVDTLPESVRKLVERAGGSYPVVYVGSYDMGYTAIYAAGDYDEETAARDYLHASVPNIYPVTDKALARYYATEYQGPQQVAVWRLGEEILKEMNEREDDKELKIRFNATCPICKTDFHVKPSHLKRFKQVCCSRECSKALRSIRMTGCGNHQFGLTGDKNASFKGYEIKRKNNRQVDIMVYVPDHPYANEYGRVKKHRLIVEQHHDMFDDKFFEIVNGKKYLKKCFFVHHIDGNHGNNNVNNLAVLSRAEHRRVHNLMSPQTRDAKSGRFCKCIRTLVKVKRISKTAKMPFLATVGSAGFDLYADRIEKTDQFVRYYTGVAVQIPAGYFGMLVPRSSVVNMGLLMGNSVGIIDSDYVGELSAVFYLRSDCKIYNVGDRIGQLVIIPIPAVKFVEVDELSETERGAGGYGSTGR